MRNVSVLRTDDLPVRVTVYATSAMRLYQTFFRRHPVRVLCYAPDEDGRGVHLVHDLVVPPRRVALLPPHQVRLALAADACAPLPLLHVIANRYWQALHYPRTAWGTDNLGAESAYALFVRMLVSALSDLKAVLKTPLPTLPLDQRVRVVTAAAFLLENEVPDVRLPRTALHVAEAVLDAVHPQEVRECLFWHDVEGVLDDIPAPCLRCGKEGIWQQVILPAPEVPELQRWRYHLPENHVPLCYTCRHTLKWHLRPDIRRAVALALWGERFRAFFRWHEAARAHSLPEDWDTRAYPYWPPQFGGNTWETGSGAAEHADLTRIPDIEAARRRFTAIIGRLRGGYRRDKIGTPPASACYSEREAHNEEAGRGHDNRHQPAGSRPDRLPGLRGGQPMAGRPG